MWFYSEQYEYIPIILLEIIQYYIYFRLFLVNSEFWISSGCPFRIQMLPMVHRIRISFVKIIKEGACSKFVWLSNVGGKKKGGGKHAYLNFIMFFFFSIVYRSGAARLSVAGFIIYVLFNLRGPRLESLSSVYLFWTSGSNVCWLEGVYWREGKASRRKSVYIMYCGKRENFSVEKIGYFYSCRREMVSMYVCAFITVHIRMYRYDKFRGRPIFGAHSCK